MAHRGSSSQHFPFASFPVRNGPTPRKLPGAAPTSRSELTTATATGSAGASRLGGLAKSAATARRGAVEEEYVRNLQQQVYLLELETRYLKNRRGDDDDENQDSPSAPLKDTFRHLKLKYVELQEKFKKEIRKLEDQLEAEQTETGTKDRSIAALQAENTSLRDDITTLRAARENQNDILHQEFLELRQQHEVTLAENQRLQTSYDRVVAEKLVLESRSTQQVAEIQRQANTIAMQTKSMASLQDTAAAAIQRCSELEAHIDPNQHTPIDALQKSNQELVIENTALRAQIVESQSQDAALRALQDRMKEELTRVSTECASLRTDLIEAQREERRAKGILADEREQTRKEKEARERKRQELAGGDESLLLNSEDVEIAILRRDLNAMAGDAAIKDELIKELELHIEEAHQQVVELSENNIVLGERAEKVLLSLKRREEATVILEEEKRSLAVALKQLEVQTAKVDQSEKLLKERLSKKEAEMDMATKEIVRLTHVQRVANQMHEWKAMMEESSKMANEMKTLVSAFGSDMAVTSVQEEPQQKEQENTQLVKKVSATGQPQQNVASEMADPTGALEDALSGISY